MTAGAVFVCRGLLGYRWGNAQTLGSQSQYFQKVPQFWLWALSLIILSLCVHVCVCMFACMWGMCKHMCALSVEARGCHWLSSLITVPSFFETGSLSPTQSSVPHLDRLCQLAPPQPSFPELEPQAGCHIYPAFPRLLGIWPLVSHLCGKCFNDWAISLTFLLFVYLQRHKLPCAVCMFSFGWHFPNHFSSILIPTETFLPPGFSCPLSFQTCPVALPSPLPQSLFPLLRDGSLPGFLVSIFSLT